MLLGGAERHHHAARAPQVGFDFLPGGLCEQHEAGTAAPIIRRFAARPAARRFAGADRMTAAPELQARAASRAAAMIEVAGVSKWFGAFRALDGVDLQVAPAEKVVVCGPSGSGKSTLIRCICRLERHEQGRIVVDGVELDDDKASRARIHSEVGMVFQQFNLFPHLTVLQNLTLAPVRVRRMPPREAEALAMHYLERVRIPEQAAKYPAQLSGGQQQRVAIARSLCMRPRVMLFDEPTSALDPEMISEVLDVMVDLAREGMTMICVTHEMGFARKAADTMIFMDHGRIVERAPAAEFFAAPRSERGREFLARILNH
jgi:general L-amino acid transport system ATP-binding protein